VSVANAIEAAVGWLDAMRRRDLAAAGQWFDPWVIWRDIGGNVVCRDRAEVVEMLGDSVIPCPEDRRADEPEPGLRGAVAIELIGAGPARVVLGAKLPGMTETAGGAVAGQLFNVLRIHDGLIVEVADYARRDAALAAAGTDAPRWA
jgi:hypothetical protein